MQYRCNVSSSHRHLHFKPGFCVGSVVRGFSTYSDEVSEQGWKSQSQLSLPKPGEFGFPPLFGQEAKAGMGRTGLSSGNTEHCASAPAAPGAHRGRAGAHRASPRLGSLFVRFKLRPEMKYSLSNLLFLAGPWGERQRRGSCTRAHTQNQ